MIKGKTKSGFEFQLEDDVMNNMELVDLLADDSENEIIKTSKTLKMIMDPDQKKRLYDHLRTQTGRVPADAVMRVIEEIFTACGQQGKNS